MDVQPHTDKSANLKDGKSAQPKRKKKAPDRPQPEWLFPADEDNPVLNPKHVSDEKARKDKEDWDGAVKFLQHKAVTAPMKDPPPGMLLTLVGAFLTSYGFHPASRLFTTHVAARARLDGWKTELGVKLPKGCPDLVKIFNDWHVDWEATRSAEDDSDEEKPNDSKKSKAGTENAGEISREAISSNKGDSSGSANSSSDVSMKDAPKARPTQLKRKMTSDESSTSLSDSASSVSSSSDEAEPPTKKAKVAKTTKLKVEPSKSKPSKLTQAKATPEESSSSSISSSTDSSDSDSDSDDGPASGSIQNPKSRLKKLGEKGSKVITKITIAQDSSKSSDSSTLEGSPVKDTADATSSTSSTSSSSSESTSSASTPPVQEKTMKKSDKKRKRSKSPIELKVSADTPVKVSKTQNAPFQRISKDTVVDPKLASNAYVPYDYADRAHKDLSVTRGKGFTKEKNKKKRGSYRGGQIDVEGKKAIKFDD